MTVLEIVMMCFFIAVGLSWVAAGFYALIEWGQFTDSRLDGRAKHALVFLVGCTLILFVWLVITMFGVAFAGVALDWATGK